MDCLKWKSIDLVFSRIRGNVTDPLNPLFLTLDPPTYSKEFKKESILEDITFENTQYTKLYFRKKKRAGKSLMLVSSLLESLEYGIHFKKTKNMTWKCCISDN